MLLRLFAFALMVVFSCTMLPATADADFTGIFDNSTSVGELDDDFDEVLRRLRPPAATDSSAAVLGAWAPPTIHLPLFFSGAGATSWIDRPPADRGPPAAATRHQIHPAPPRVAPAPGFQPDLQPFPLASPESPAHHHPGSERNTSWQA